MSYLLESIFYAFVIVFKIFGLPILIILGIIMIIRLIPLISKLIKKIINKE